MTTATGQESAAQGMNPDSGTGVVYVMSNQDTGNSVTVFDRAADGGLTLGPPRGLAPGTQGIVAI
ncbi:MAG: hypothetical protein ACRDRI_00130 [Pseudonocardiaceae bacterium]